MIIKGPIYGDKEHMDRNTKIMEAIIDYNGTTELAEFASFSKIPRWSRDIVITEKLDGTNAQIYITDDGDFYTGSRNRWVSPGKDDNYGFAGWAHGNKEDLLKLGPGRHFGEWWGKGIQRGYGLTEKRFSLFNVSKWNTDNIPQCCSVVPILDTIEHDSQAVRIILSCLTYSGSKAAPGFMDPEGIVIFHTASGHLYKKTCKDDEKPKGS